MDDGIKSYNSRDLGWEAEADVDHRRWSNYLRRIAGLTWMRDVQDRKLWREKREAYIQYWMQTG